MSCMSFKGFLFWLRIILLMENNSKLAKHTNVNVLNDYFIKEIVSSNYLLKDKILLLYKKKQRLTLKKKKDSDH